MKVFNLLSIMVAVCTLRTATSPAATCLVTATDDSGPGSLRQAILDADADSSTNDVSIEFNIPGSGVQTIAPLTPLPVITRAVTIDGYTQPGTSPNTLAAGDNATLLIELSGASVFYPSYGLVIAADGCTVRGLVANRFAAAVLVTGEPNYGGFGHGNVIEGNFLGTDATGTHVPSGNNLYNGINIFTGTDNRVGGLTPASRNVIGGNSYVGIDVAYGSVSNQFFGNYVGLGADGLTVVPNGFGIGFDSSSSQNQVGRSNPWCSQCALRQYHRLRRR